MGSEAVTPVVYRTSSSAAREMAVWREMARRWPLTPSMRSAKELVSVQSGRSTSACSMSFSSGVCSAMVD